MGYSEYLTDVSFGKKKKNNTQAGNFLFICNLPQMQGNEMLAFHPHSVNQRFPHFINKVIKLQGMIICSTPKFL